MPVAMDISFDSRQLADIRALLRDVPLGLEKALSRALNKIGVFARTQVMKMIAREINIKLKDLRGRNVRLRRASFGRLFVVLSITGRRIPLTHFSARQTKRGVTYRIRRSGRRQRIDDAFIQRMDSGHVGVFVRSGQPRISRTLADRTNKRRGQRKGLGFLVRPRLPISERFGPSIPQVVTHARDFASGALERGIHNRLGGEVQTQVTLIIEKHGREISLVPI